MYWMRRYACSLASSKLPRIMFLPAPHATAECDVAASGVERCLRMHLGSPRLSAQATPLRSLLAPPPSIAQQLAKRVQTGQHVFPLSGRAWLLAVWGTNLAVLPCNRQAMKEAGDVCLPGTIVVSPDGRLAISASRRWLSRMVCRSRTGSRASNCSRRAALLASATFGSANSRSHGVIGA